MILNILLTLVVLNIMVIAHELGHYLLAKKNKIGVHEFAVGFGPTLWKKEWMDTMWMIKAFPLGGYNGLKGEMDDERRSGNFSSASKKAKFQVLIAGPLMNIVLAVVSFYIALALYGWKVPIPVTFTPVGAELTAVGAANIPASAANHPIVTAIAVNSPMSKVNITPPFVILSVNGRAVATPQDVVTAIANSTTDQITLLVDTTAKTETIVVTRDTNKRIGVSIDSTSVQLDYSTKPLNKLFSGFSHVVNVTILTGKMLTVMVQYTIKTRNLEPIGYAFAGPVAIVAAVGSVVKDSKTVFADLANLTGLIGVSLAIFNILPFPGLDGWHIFLLFYEKARGRKPNQKLVGIITAIGMILLLSLGVLIMFKDVWLFFLKR